METEVKTKQQEIREVIDHYTDDRCLFPDRVCNALGAGYCSSQEEAYKCLLQRLDSQGVVLKVVPNEKWCPQHGYPTPCYKCGTVTERLVEDK
ncbi:hypothetical protein LCGC14_1608270 [marine sediment metagenome]|uniref:Uncharacterized protein n=1 Tax=marine sediment metagenome TaxID=412755 RepID=A0A0F9I931_9ZZZZ